MNMLASFLMDINTAIHFGDDVKQGEVDEDGIFFSYLTLNSSESKLPVAKIDGKKFTRLSDSKEFSLVSEL